MADKLPDFRQGSPFPVSAAEWNALKQRVEMISNFTTQLGSGLRMDQGASGTVLGVSNSTRRTFPVIGHKRVAITDYATLPPGGGLEPQLVDKLDDAEFFLAREVRYDGNPKDRNLIFKGDRFPVHPYPGKSLNDYSGFKESDPQPDNDTKVMDVRPDGLFWILEKPPGEGGGGQKWVRISEAPDQFASVLMVQEVEQDFEDEEDPGKIVEVGDPFEAPTNIQLTAGAYEYMFRNNIIIKLEKFGDVWYVDLTSYLHYQAPSTRARSFC